MRSRPYAKPELLILPFLRPGASVLRPPRRFLSRARRPGWPIILLATLSGLGSLLSVILLLAGQSGSAMEAFWATMLLLLGLLISNA